jgi:hypothetical protein
MGRPGRERDDRTDEVSLAEQRDTNEMQLTSCILSSFFILHSYQERYLPSDERTSTGNFVSFVASCFNLRA